MSADAWVTLLDDLMATISSHDDDGDVLLIDAMRDNALRLPAPDRLALARALVADTPGVVVARVPKYAASPPWSSAHAAGFNAAITAILSALTAAGYTVEQGWQPIATAPRDGTPVVLIGIYPDGKTWSDQLQCWWQWTARPSPVVKYDGQWVRWHHSMEVVPPTHWRPLPAAPTTKEDAP